MKIVTVGAGYVGLVSGACLADFGHKVACVDRDPEKIAALLQGRIPIYEPGLDKLVADNVKAGRLTFGTDLREGIADADAVFIAVGTPSRRGDGVADLSYVFDAARDIAALIDGFTVIVTKSTVPVGTGDEVERIVRELRPDADFVVVSNPEFLREGAAISDFKHPDRVIVGAEDERGRAVMAQIYRPLSINAAPVIFMSRRTAELTKYAANAFLATKITFINEMADLCEAVDANVQDVARGMGLDKRIGSKFLHAGPGYGGSCFPKDTVALLHTAQQHGRSLRIVETVASVNEQRKRDMALRIIAACGGSVTGKVVAMLGLTFKPNTDDMREAPSLAIIPALQEAGAQIRAYDPQGMKQASRILTGVCYADDAYHCATGADAVVIVTEWDAFRALDLKLLKTLMTAPVIIDLRNIYRADEIKTSGFTYVDVGRGGA